MDEVTIIWLIVIAIPLTILEIVMIVRFFQIASDIRALKHFLVDSYKTLKTKDKYGDSVEFNCYKEDLLKTISDEEWEKARENVLKQKLAERYEKYYQHVVQESKENNETQPKEEKN